jgi:hypothetical protein
MGQAPSGKRQCVMTYLSVVINEQPSYIGVYVTPIHSFSSTTV